MSDRTDEMVSDAVSTPEPGTEEFETQLHEEFAKDLPSPEEPAEVDLPSAEQEVAEEPQATAEGDVPPPLPDYVEIAGTQVPADKAKALADFWTWSQNEGQAWLYTLNELQQRGIDPRTLLDGPPTRPEVPQVPEAPPEPDVYVDPSVQAAVQQAIQPLQSELERLRAEEAQRHMATIQATANAASERFAQEHGMSTTEAWSLLQRAGNTMNFQAFVTDPATGQQRDQVSAITAAMEAAMWTDPAYKQRELDRIASEHTDRQKKNRKLAAVGGTSGSIPQKPQPTTAEERESWAVEQISEAMGLAK